MQGLGCDWSKDWDATGARTGMRLEQGLGCGWSKDWDATGARVRFETCMLLINYCPNKCAI